MDGVAVEDFVQSWPFLVIGDVPVGDEFVEFRVLQMLVVVLDS